MSEESNVMRQTYRELTVTEKEAMLRIKDKGAEFFALCDKTGQSRELSLAKTKIEEAVMWATKHITKVVVLFMVVGLVGCTSVVQRENGTWDVPRQVEKRSVFGTNQSALEIQTCKTEVVKWYWENTYKDCMELVPYAQASSPGVGGPIVSGMVMGLGFGLGLAHGGSNQHNQTDIRASTVNPAPAKK